MVVRGAAADAVLRFHAVAGLGDGANVQAEPRAGDGGQSQQQLQRDDAPE